MFCVEFISGLIKLSLVSAHLVHCQVDACVGDDAEHVGDVAFIKRSESLSPENLLGTVGDTGVLSGLPQSETSFQHLGGRFSKESQFCLTGVLKTQKQAAVKLIITSMG